MLASEDIQNEIDAIEKVCQQGHRKIVQVYNHGYLKGSPYYSIDMELCDSSLSDYIRDPPRAYSPRETA